jgi:hypothetical protein
MKLRWIAVLGIAALAVSVVGVASAHTKRFNTNVTINFDPSPYGDSFFGKVKSGKKACKKNRTVKVFRKRPGPDDQFDGRDKSNRRGRWRITDGNAAPGNYYAKAKKKVLKNNNRHKHVCKRDRSRTISVP